MGQYVVALLASDFRSWPGCLPNSSGRATRRPRGTNLEARAAPASSVIACFPLSFPLSSHSADSKSTPNTSTTAPSLAQNHPHSLRGHRNAIHMAFWTPRTEPLALCTCCTGLQVLSTMDFSLHEALWTTADDLQPSWTPNDASTWPLAPPGLDGHRQLTSWTAWTAWTPFPPLPCLFIPFTHTSQHSRRAIVWLASTLLTLW